MRLLNCAWANVAASLALLFLHGPSFADNWPERPVRLIGPTGAGSGSDVSARLFANGLSRHWKQPIMVENRPGADGLTGVVAFTALRDDHALLYSFAAPVSVFPALHERLPYDPVRDVVPISWTVDNFVAVANNSKFECRFALRSRQARSLPTWEAQLQRQRRRTSICFRGLSQDHANRDGPRANIVRPI